MPINPRFLAARAAERRLRALIHLRALCWLPLRRSGIVIGRTPLVPLTLRSRLELKLARNSFFLAGAPPLLGDVFLFLWRLHPHYCALRPLRAGAIANLASRRFRFLRVWWAHGSFRAAVAHRLLTARVRRCDLSAAISSIQAFLAATYQDNAGDDAKVRRRGSAAPERDETDNQVDYLMTVYRLTAEQALDLPLALAHQLYRERQLQKPDGDLNVFAPSDALL